MRALYPAQNGRLAPFIRRSTVAHLLVAAIILTAGHLAPARRSRFTTLGVVVPRPAAPRS